MSQQADRLSAALTGRYRIERELGAGGMATVYLAHDEKHGRKVALKLLKPEASAALGEERFRREIEIVAQLQHPHIVSLFDSGDVDGQRYYLMPFVDGETLRQRLRREKRVPPDGRLLLFRNLGATAARADELILVVNFAEELNAKARRK